MRFIFQHGWGFSHSCWSGWLELMDSPPILGNRGYWGIPTLLEHSAIPPGFILVCHSLGVHLVPQPLFRQAKMVVIISGFAHFHGATIADGRFSKRHVQRMLSRLTLEPLQLIHDFHRDCNVTTPTPLGTEDLNTSLLAADLKILDTSQLEKSACRKWPPTLLIHGQTDRIVAPQRTEELATLLPISRVRIIDGAGHGLPFNQPRLCFNLIVDFSHHIAHSGGEQTSY